MNYQRSIQIVKTNENGKENEVIEESIQQNGKKWTRKIVKTPQQTRTYQDVRPVPYSSHSNDPSILSLIHRGRMPIPAPGPASVSDQWMYSLSPTLVGTRRHRKKRKNKTKRKETSKEKTQKRKKERESKK